MNIEKERDMFDDSDQESEALLDARRNIGDYKIKTKSLCNYINVWNADQTVGKYMS